MPTALKSTGLASPTPAGGPSVGSIIMYSEQLVLPRLFDPIADLCNHHSALLQRLCFAKQYMAFSKSFLSLQKSRGINCFLRCYEHRFKILITRFYFFRKVCFGFSRFSWFCYKTKKKSRQTEGCLGDTVGRNFARWTFY